MDPKVQGRKLLKAIFEGKYDNAMSILNHPVDFNVEMGGDNAIHLAARKGRLDLIKAMVAKGASVQQKNQNGNTAAHYAAKEGFLDILQYIKTLKADINCMNKDGNTPLHIAVIHQPLNVIERLVDLGMSPNILNNNTGETPIHVAAAYGRLPAIEALLIKGGTPDIPDRQNRKAEDVATTEELRQAMASYTSMYSALKTGFVQAAGLQISPEIVSKRLRLDRVEIYIESIDIPKGLPVSFYCRREKSENASVSLKTRPEEYVLSDLFHIQISDARRDCAAKIYIPIYMAAPEKEELVLRFLDNDQDDKVLDKTETIEGAQHCLVETTLIPETMCICIVFTRPKQEDKAISKEGAVIESNIEPNFKMDIPPAAFKKQTVLTMKVYDSDTNDAKETTKTATTKSEATSLITGVFQINVKGEQPRKAVNMQLPTSGSLDAEEMVILTMDERQLDKGVLPEVVPVTPEVVNTNIVFEVSHFCIYVAVPKDSVATEENLKIVTRQISDVKNRRKKASFVAVCKQVKGREHSLLVECGLENRKNERLDKWLSKGYEKCDNYESDSVMLAPGDTFFVDIMGGAKFESRANAQNRKLVFSQCRSSFQAFAIQLNEHVTRPEDAVATVVINKQNGKALEKVFSLNVQLHVPPPASNETPQEVQFDFIEPVNCTIGEDMTVGVVIRNATSEDKTVSIRMTLSAVSGNEITKLKEDTRETVINASIDERCVMVVPAKEYQAKGSDCVDFNLTTHCTVVDTNQMYISIEKLSLKKPTVEILCDDNLPVGSKSTATVSFTNNTNLTLHGGVFTVKANFIVDARKFSIIREISTGETVNAQVHLVPKKVGVWPITASFKAAEFVEVTGEKMITVTKN